MLRWVLVSVAAAVAGLVVYLATLPATYRLQAVVAIDAPPGRVYPYLANMREVHAWSPWVNRDPFLKTAFTGPEAGKGAIYAWSGNRAVGAGRMTIVEAVADKSVTMDLEFTEPTRFRATSALTVEPAGSGSEVTWRVEGESGFATRAFETMKQFSADYEQGLANLKTRVETQRRQ